MKEQKELEAKIANIDNRINAIKKLRDSQAGPSAVLEALRERIAMTPGLYLLSVEQAGDQLTIKGNSPNEATVTAVRPQPRVFKRPLLQSQYRNAEKRRDEPGRGNSIAAGRRGAGQGSDRGFHDQMRLHADPGSPEPTITRRRPHRTARRPSRQPLRKSLKTDLSGDPYTGN